MITEKAVTDVTALISGIVRKIALQPEKVRVDAKPDGDATSVFLYVSRPDFNTLIQSEARAMKSLKVVAEALAKRSGLKVKLNVLEEV